MRSFALAVMVGVAFAGCSVDVDSGETRFRCDDDPICPDDFTCVAGECVPDGVDPAIDAAPPAIDAPIAPPPDAPPGEPDAPALPACDDTYGMVPEYLLCEETATTCKFNALTNGGNCLDMCAAYGGTCITAFDNENGVGQECIEVIEETCTVLRTSEICVCTR
jgi:hypothetical protein